jgi:hypothetical protein
MSNETLTKIGESIVQKFANEEIMTKSELSIALDTVMEKHTRHIDAKFELMDAKIDALRVDVDKRFEQVDKRFTQIDLRYNWIIGLVITATIGIIGVLVKLH